MIDRNSMDDYFELQIAEKEITLLRRQNSKLSRLLPTIVKDAQHDHTYEGIREVMVILVFILILPMFH